MGLRKMGLREKAGLEAHTQHPICVTFKVTKLEGWREVFGGQLLGWGGDQLGVAVNSLCLHQVAGTEP